MRTIYTFFGDGKPMTISVSWEPAALTTGTPVMLPEEGPRAGKGVVERWPSSASGSLTWKRTWPPGPRWPRKRNGSASGPEGPLLRGARTYHTAERPVETADIVIPAERYSLVYEVPVG
jgi:GntR family transcriptional regulator